MPLWRGWGHLGLCNGKQGRLANLHDWVRFSLGAQFMQPCATSKPKSLVNYLSEEVGILILGLPV